MKLKVGVQSFFKGKVVFNSNEIFVCVDAVIHEMHVDWFSSSVCTDGAVCVLQRRKLS